ncbi:hypothetical protein WRSd3_00997 [Shigella dysenteriae WRSd3]|uniref:Uncharacterized protein n=2 Tax=Shigella dysenteriae TaxID=622 RepID=A0A090NL89_SHIDY|nr:hypothetical protein Asd1617_03554 [Shigella dysenteriae 1617]ESU81084.1 hypothetical protein WRSd3_00997 [Shigella dysenteriae WRSd3]
MKRKPNRCNSFLTLTLTLNIQGKRFGCNILVKLITEFANNKKSNIKYLDIILFIFMRRI